MLSLVDSSERKHQSWRYTELAVFCAIISAGASSLLETKPAPNGIGSLGPSLPEPVLVCGPKEML